MDYKEEARKMVEVRKRILYDDRVKLGMKWKKLILETAIEDYGRKLWREFGGNRRMRG